MTPLGSQTTRLVEYIKELLPCAHGHQLKAIATFVAAIIDKQTAIRRNWHAPVAIRRPPATARALDS